MATLRECAELVLRHATTDGKNATVMPGLTLLRANESSLVTRGILNPSCCVVLQGEKVAHAGDATLRYQAGHFLASSIDMPLVGQVVGATRARPYLGAWFDLTPQEVLSVVDEATIRIDAGSGGPATFVGTADDRLIDIVYRSLRALNDEREARFLAPLLRRELVYRLVTGPSAAAVRESAVIARNGDGVGRAVDWIRTHYREPISIADLAKRAKMSTSSLHHKFKATVLMGPLQYQKRLRLEEARRLMASGLADATSAAFHVGYESASQFSREYRRQYGLPPLRDVKRLQSDVVQDQATSLRHPAGREERAFLV